MQLGWFVGVDWGSQTYQACVTDAAGEVVAERAFEHGGQGLSEMADWLLSMAGGEAAAVGVAIEVPRGPVVESLMKRGFVVHSINPGTVSRRRARRTTVGTRGCWPRRCGPTRTVSGGWSRPTRRSSSCGSGRG